jgi:hypothetical protein
VDPEQGRRDDHSHYSTHLQLWQVKHCASELIVFILLFIEIINVIWLNVNRVIKKFICTDLGHKHFTYMLPEGKVTVQDGT